MPSAVTTVPGDRAAGEPSPPGGASARASAVAPGERIGGRYVVEEVLGSGGMGIVLAARHEALGHRVAMKLVSGSTSVDAFLRFSREARIIASLESDHIVRVLDYGMHAGAPYMVMELLAGRDLGAELRTRGALPVTEAVDYAIEACDGLSVAHARGIVHRDVKLANLFAALRADGERVLKVLDFGVSKFVADAQDDVHLTHTTTTIGSPLYMSPEQIRDPRTVDARADVWSLGVVLYKLLTNEPPFDGLSASAVCASIAADAPRPIGAGREELPKRLQAVVLRCLEKRREERYPSVAALARDLAPFASPRGRAVADALVLRATADGALEPLVSPPEAESLLSARAAEDDAAAMELRPRAARPQRPLLWASALAVVLLGGGAAVAAVAAHDHAVRAVAAAPLDTSAITKVALATIAPPGIAPSSSAPVAAAPPDARPNAGPPGASRASLSPKHASGGAGGGVVATRPAPSAPTTHFGGSALDDHH